MKKYALFFYGAEKPKTEEAGQKMMTDWMSWTKELGDKLTDNGSAFAKGAKEVGADETKDITSEMWPCNGYNIVEANDMEEATKLGRSCPMFSEANPNFAVRVYELLDVAM